MEGFLFPALIAYCLVLPNIHFPALASQTVIPREIFIYLFSIVFVVTIARSNAIKLNGFYLAALSFCLWQLITLSWSSDTNTGQEELLNYYFFLFSSFIFFQIDESRKKSALFAAIVFSVSLSCLIGIWQNFNWNPLQLYQGAAPSSTYVNKDLAASAALLFLPLSLALLLSSEKRSRKLLFFTSSFLILSYILVSHTKGVWLAGIILFACAGLAFYFSGSRQRCSQYLADSKSYVISIVAVSLLIFSLPGVRNIEPTTADQYSITSASASIRMGFYRDALQLVAEHPIAGIGTGSFRREFRSRPGGTYQAQHAQQDMYLTRLHNDHLQYLIEQGLPGFLLWLSMIYLFIRTIGSYLKDESALPKERLIAFSLFLGIAGMAIHAIFFFPLRNAATGSLFWLAIGLALSYCVRSAGNREIILTPLKRYLLIPLLLLITLFSVHYITKQAIGSYLLKQASESISKSYCFAAKTFANNSVEAADMDIPKAHVLSLIYDICPSDTATEANQAMERILAFEPNHSRALLIKGDIAYKTGDNLTAARLYEETLRVNPASIRAYLGLARIHHEAHRDESALLMAERALEIDGSNQAAREFLDSLQR